MDDSSQAGASPGPDNDANRRRSGRVSKKPALLVDQLGVSAPKRKRVPSAAEANADVDGDVDMDQEVEEEEDDSPSEPDDSQDEDVKPARKKARKAAGAGTKRKTNGNGVHHLAIRPAKPRAKPRVKKAARFSSAADAGGLYAEVFGNGKVLDDVSAIWIGEYKENAEPAVADLLTFTLRAAGCEHEIDVSVVADPDSFSDRIADIQNKYQAENLTEYPIVSRAKGTAAFRQTLTGFISSLVLTIHKGHILFEDTTLIEVFISWVSTLSSTGNRALRHTATVIALETVSALAEVARELVTNTAKIQLQIEGEKKKKRANKAVISEGETAKRKNDIQVTYLNERLTDLVDAVFVHRYRDVDPHIRLDCIHALSVWIVTYPDMFFEGTFLRYLGWLLSDLKPDIRHEVLKGLISLYTDKDKHAGLESFTEKFRSRMTEMATRDSDGPVRAAAIELLDLLRDAKFLEPDDIDAVGQLIFDSEPKVRKAVVNFFIANVEDGHELKLEELGGAEAMEEIFGEEQQDEDDYDTPRPEWLKIKALVEQLESYDAQLQIDAPPAIQVPKTDHYMLVAQMESRFSMAAEAICDRIPELQWELLAGYLLYDHSTVTQNGANGVDAMSQFKEAVRLSSEEEVLLLEVLNAAVRVSFAQTTAGLADKSKKTSKAQRVVEQDNLETSARHLITTIPQLLNKFGATPVAASAILRLEHVLDPSKQDFANYGTLLEDIKKQFQAHATSRVLEEASLALLNARSAGEADEMAQEKLGALTEDAIDKLNGLAKANPLNMRGSLDDAHIEVLEGVVTRLEMLTRIEDFGDALETAPAESRKKQSAPAPIDSLLAVLSRGIPTANADEETAAQENTIVKRAARTLVFYFMWKVNALQRLIKASGTVPTATVKAIAMRKQKFVQSVANVIAAKGTTEEVKVALAGALIDLYAAFASLLHVNDATRARNEGAESSSTPAYLELAAEVPLATQTVLLQLLSGTERAYAKRLGKTLENPEDADDDATDAEPEDDEVIPDAEDDEARLKATLVAEQTLCEFAGKLVLGIWAGVVDGRKEGASGKVKRRLKRNKMKLGTNFRAVIDMMEKGAPGAAPKKKAAPKPQKEIEGAKKSAAIIVESGSESEEEEEQDQEEKEAEAGDLEQQEPEEREEAEEPAIDDEPESILGD
ncbi:STAG-domain-containing protein [Microthyrium microscopicum]|uniref:STAG-domain-containing protein n=1 Tax=Microthyrium microscopicum TaxID=703497 RepID=A0A6A6UHY0_9PEZI|nr:STAG-domain-containing protein [Microthyrium microscopicum]